MADRVSATLYIVHYIYNNGFASPFREFGLAAATSLVMAAVLIVLTLIQIRVQGTGLEEETEKRAPDQRSRLSNWFGAAWAVLWRNMLDPVLTLVQTIVDGIGEVLNWLFSSARRSDCPDIHPISCWGW